MYLLNKIVGFLINPIEIGVGLMFLSMIFGALKKKRLARWIMVFGVTWFWCWATPVMSRMVGAALEREFLVDGRVPRVDDCQTADAIVILGGGMGANTNVSDYAEMWTGADRVWHGVRLYKAGKAPLIIASGGEIVEQSTLPFLIDLGVPTNVVRLLKAARNTEEEARTVGKIIRDDGGHRILLVTSAWHMKRALLMYEKYASEIEVVPAATDFENTFAASRSFSMFEFLPDLAALAGNAVAFHEWLGYFGYKLFRR